ncbi:uncharacterized protein LOC121181415 [Toxotes jaculatrix]|uniref:uncharacterized protein LOC121181415 n=1 Tax=Toxotes jaculatrix TaxID=941984 RepID=UPI001B3B06BD|nr:uncharacterized protein LOC121181415 [Toxotes jaculatrix]
MRTKAILVLTLFVPILLIPASSDGNQTLHSNTSSTFVNKAATTETPAQWEETSANNASSSKSSPSSSPSTSPTRTTAASHTGTNSQSLSSALTMKPTESTAKSSKSKIIISVTLLSIMALMLLIGCFHTMRNRQSGQDNSVPRLLLGVRERLRAAVSNLENRLWPGGKRGGEDDDEEAGRGQEEEGGQRSDDGGEGGSGGSKNHDKDEHNDEDSDTSDCSSMEGDNLRMGALNRQEEEERKNNKEEDEDETSSASSSGVEGDSSGDKAGGSEEMALVNSPQEHDENVDLCDVTAL